jgi:hypothetical protein
LIEVNRQSNGSKMEMSEINCCVILNTKLPDLSQVMDIVFDNYAL